MRTVEEIKVDINNYMNYGTQAQIDKVWLEWFRVIAQGIEPDRLEEICRAEREGRCEVLPCKVGDTVYWCSRFGNAIYKGKVFEIKISNFGFDLELRNADNQRFLREAEKCHFTRQAAERALKEREQDV